MQQKLPENLFISGSILLITILIGGWIVIPLVVRNLVERQLVLEPGAKLYKEWVDVKNTTFRIYIFNVTNPEEIQSGGEPVLVEIGPYAYDKILTRHVRGTTENDTILYEDVFTYHFNEELSNGKESDEIILLNVPFLGVAQQVAKFSSFTRFIALSYILKFKSEVFVRRSVGDYLFKGTYEPMINEIEKLTNQFYLPNSTFGIFYGANGTSPGLMEVNSGKQESFRVGEIVSWKGESKLDFWTSPYCNMMNGTDATLFSSFFPKDRPLYVFQHDICRSMKLVYNEEVEMWGIRVYTFRASPNLLDAPKDNPNNRCFCTEEDVDKCFGTGVYSMKSCRNDEPVIISQPHFLGAEAAYAQKFGFHPKKEMHESRLFLEPQTGAPLEIRKRMQINADVRKLSKVTEFKAIQDMIFPMIWVEEEYIMPDELFAEINSMLLNPLKMIDFSRWFVVGFSLLLIVISGIIFMVRTRKKSVFV